MERDYLDFEVSIESTAAGQVARDEFACRYGRHGLHAALQAGGARPVHDRRWPPRVSSRRLVPAEAPVREVKDYGARLGDALLAGDVGRCSARASRPPRAGLALRVRLFLEGSPDLEPVPWEYLYDSGLGRFLTLSTQTPIVRSFDALDVPAPVRVSAPLRVLVLISSPSDVPELAVAHEEELLRATTPTWSRADGPSSSC